MRHDAAHEVKQNKVLRMLAQAISQTAAHNGHSGFKSLAEEVDAILDADESEPSEAVVVSEPAPVVPAVVDGELEF
jgi:hypothetical protein